jgi:predicted transcriptional regulator
MRKDPIAHNRPDPSPDADRCGLIAQAVIDLHIARRTLLIYPGTHEQVKRSIAKAFKSLGEITGPADGITLIALKEGIGVGDQVLDAKSPVLADFAGILKHYEIATVTIKKNLKANELARFLQLICLDRAKIVAKGGMAAVVGELEFPNIDIQAVDYSQLQWTAEDEIHRSTVEAEEKGSIWQQFISRLTATRPSEGDVISAHINPQRLAQMLNQKGVDADQVLHSYQSAIAMASKEGDGRESLARELLAFQEMIKELDDGLREQFLSATFDHCDYSDTAHLIDGLGGDLIVEMLHQAGSKGKKISPSLLSFVQKMGQAEAFPEMKPVGDSGRSESQGFASESIASLLAHEQYDTYVDGAYEKLLGQLTGDLQKTDRRDSGRSLAREVIGELTSAKIHSHAGRAITRLMTQSADISEYRDWAKQLTYLLDDLVDNGAYGYLIEVLTHFRRENKREDPERAEIAGLVLDRFNDPQFVARAIESVQSSMGEADPKALAFFIELGEPVVVEIFDGLDPDQTFHEQSVLTQILKNLRALTAKEALVRIKDPRPDYVRRMIRIIRKMGDSQSVEQIRLLMDHYDINVRMEALATLLASKNKWGLVHLRDLLGDPMGESFNKAADLAGRYRVRSVIPQLEAVAVQRGETSPRESAIRALGQIGDPEAIPALTKIARARWRFAKSQTRYLKRVVFDTLDNYPSEAVHNLLRFGLKQKDAVIRAACERLLRQGGKSRQVKTL